jgi:hypothetical protein
MSWGTGAGGEGQQHPEGHKVRAGRKGGTAGVAGADGKGGGRQGLRCRVGAWVQALHIPPLIRQAMLSHAGSQDCIQPGTALTQATGTDM